MKYPGQRVLGFFSSRPNWDFPLRHSLAGEGVVGPNSDEGTYTVISYVYMYFVIPETGKKDDGGGGCVGGGGEGGLLRQSPVPTLLNS